MRVLQLGPYPPPHGGVQTHLAALVDFLRQLGATCDVVNLTRFRRSTGNGIYYPASGFAVLSHLLSHRYDIIHLHIGGRIWLKQLGLAVFCDVLPKSKSVFTFHSGGYPSSAEGRATNARTLRARVLQRFDRVIAVNEEIANFFLRIGVESERIRIISPFVLPSASVISEGRLPSSIASFFSCHDPILISIAGLEPEYDLSGQMTALGSIRETYPDAGLLVLGSGSLQESLQKEASALVYGKDIFFAGDLDHAATLKSLQSSDVMLRTTWYDGDAISVREALHLGIPVIATDNGMRPDGVRLIPPRDVDALVIKVKEVLTGPSCIRSNTQSDTNKNLKMILDVYKELIQTKENVG